MSLLSVSAVGRTSGLLLEMRIRQHYQNTTDEIIEAVYTFPLAWGAVLLGMEVEIGGKKLVGTVVGREKATRDYEEAISEGDTPVMLQQSSPGLYTTNLGNLKPGEEAIIEYRYAQLLRFEQGKVRISLPTTIAPRYGDAETEGGLKPHESAEASLLVEYPFHVQITLSGELAKGTIESPTHAIKVGKTDDGLSVELARKGFLDRDFVLNVSDLMGRSIATAACDNVDGGLTIVIASFCPEIVGTPQAGTEIKILVDCSGSMAGDSIESAKKALHQVLAELTPEDWFSFSRFGRRVEHAFPRPRKASSATIKSASETIAKMDADMGGTEIEAALNSTFHLGESNAASNVLLITDGEVWNIDPVVDAAMQSGHRIFAVGVGSSPAETLLRELAERTGGACELVSPNEDIEQAIIRTFHRIRGALTASTEVSWGAKPVWSLPVPLAIYAGDTVHVIAAFESGAGITPALRIGADGIATLIEAHITSDTTSEILSRVAAYQRLRHIPEDERQSLALKYQLITENTSLFLLHERAANDKATDMPQLQKIAHMTAAGWGGSGSVTERRMMSLRQGYDSMDHIQESIPVFLDCRAPDLLSTSREHRARRPRPEYWSPEELVSATAGIARELLIDPATSDEIIAAQFARVSPHMPAKVMTSLRRCASEIQLGNSQLAEMQLWFVFLVWLHRRVSTETAWGLGKMDTNVALIITIPGSGLLDGEFTDGILKDIEELTPRRIIGAYGRGSYTRRWLGAGRITERTQIDDLALIMELADMRGPVTNGEVDAFLEFAHKCAEGLKRPMIPSIPLEQILTRAEQIYDLLLGRCRVTRSDIEFAAKYLDRELPNITEESWE
jgi:Ca-activated chloride channel family protein